MFDMSFMAKFLVQGPDAGALLEHAVGEPRRRPEGRVTYTPWLNEGGTVEADLTVTKLDAERYLVVASDTVHRHVETWLRRHLPGRRGDRHRRDVGVHAAVSCRVRGRARCCSG